MKLLGLLILTGLILVGCANPAPTQDITAAVEAAVEATREAERAVEETSTPIPTATRRPTPTRYPTYTPVPTHTPFPTPTFVATPPAYSVDPGDIEQAVTALYDCIQSNEQFKELFIQGALLEAEGLQPETARSLAEFMLSDRDLFISLMLDGIETDPEFGVLITTLGKGLSGLCKTEIQDANTGDETGMAVEEAETVMSDFFDCLQENENAQALFFQKMKERNESYATLLEFLLRDKKTFTALLSTYAVDDPSGEEFLRSIQEGTAEACPE